MTLLRHAQCEPGPGDPDLTAVGAAQADAVAETFTTDVSIVLSSPLTRAVATARRVASTVQAPLELDERLRERSNWGDVPDQSFEAFLAEWDRSVADPSFTPSGGRSLDEAGAAIVELCCELGRRTNGGHVVAVTHGGVIAALVTHVLEGPERSIALKACDAMRFCAATVIEIRAGDIDVKEIATPLVP